MANELNKSQIDYSFPELSKFKIILIAFICFTLGFFIYFPVSEKINDGIKKALHSIPGCAISYKDLSFEFFLPKVLVKDARIPQSCLGQYGEPIALKHLQLNFQGPAFSPFGFKLRVDTEINKTPLQIHLVTGIFGGQVIRIDKNKIDLETLKIFLPNINLKGSVTTDLYARISGKKFEELKLYLNSQDFVLPAQSISAFKLPTLPLNLFSLKAELKNATTLQVHDLFVGDTNAPIRAKFQGPISLNQNNLMMSGLNLTGEIAFSEDFLEKFAIIKMFMDKFTRKDQFYQLQITGALTSPQFDSVN